MDFDIIDEKTAFKLGFAQRCFELGLEPAQVKEAMEKEARFGGLVRLLSQGWSAARPYVTSRWVTTPLTTLGGLGAGIGISGAANMAKDWSGLGLALAGGAGLLGGGLAGYAKSKLDEEDIDEDSIKAKELADTYRAYSDRLKSQKAYQQYKNQRAAIM